jgi:hypothetical protein
MKFKYEVTPQQSAIWLETRLRYKISTKDIARAMQIREQKVYAIETAGYSVAGEIRRYIETLEYLVACAKNGVPSSVQPC